MDSKMTLQKENGQEVECDIVARWNQDNFSYIAYTDGSKTDDELDLFVSRYITNGENIKLEEITDENEWLKVNQFLDKYFYEDGGYNG